MTHIRDETGDGRRRHTLETRRAMKHGTHSRRHRDVRRRHTLETRRTMKHGTHSRQNERRKTKHILNEAGDVAVSFSTHKLSGASARVKKVAEHQARLDRCNSVGEHTRVRPAQTDDTRSPCFSSKPHTKRAEAFMLGPQLRQWASAECGREGEALTCRGCRG